MLFNRNNKKSEQPDIPNRVEALPVRRPGSFIAAVFVLILAAMLVKGLVTNENFEWNVVWKYIFNENIISGIGWTLVITALSMVIATALSVILAVMRESANPVLRFVSWFYIWFFRGTPVYTQLVFWGLFTVLIPRVSLGIPFTDVTFWSCDSQDLMTAFNAAVIGLSLNESAYLAEIVRAGLEAVDPGQSEAAKALGMSHSQIMRRVILPQAMRIIVPPMGNEAIGMLKTTSLVLAVLFTLDLQFASNAIANRLYKPIPLLLVACIWYLLITSVLMVLQRMLEKHYGKGFDANFAGEKGKDSEHLPGKTMGEVKNDINKTNEATLAGLNA